MFIPETIECAGASFQEGLAVLELKRYWFARTGRLLRDAVDGDIVVGTLATLGGGFRELAACSTGNVPGGALIRTVQAGGRNRLLIAGCDAAGALFGAYRVCEHWGVYFHAHGDSMPDEPLAGCPEINEERTPLFKVRGFHPFHNFPEGPDGWSTEAYRLYFSQLAKMGMNFAGFHSYTDPRRPFEPQVWIGLPEDVDSAGRVASGYAVENWHPQAGVWGYERMDADELPLGAAALVESGVFDLHAGEEGSPGIFEAMAKRWADVFSFARRRGVSTCLGLEIPLEIPPELAARLTARGLDPHARSTRRDLWRGVFQRISRSHPLDMFWLYIPENWVWAQSIPDGEVQAVADEVALAQEVLRESGVDFSLGVAGWAVGPRNDPLALERSLPPGIPIAALSAQVGHLPISPYFSKFEKRGGWAVPWMEDDPRLTVPQLWAGRTLRDAADAHAMGCGGLLGIHWRTRGLSPQMAALARSSWDQRAWNPDFGHRFTEEEFQAASGTEGQIGGTREAWAVGGVVDSPVPEAVLQTASVGASYYRIEVPPGTYRVTCHFIEVDRKVAPGGRRMSVVANGVVLFDKGDFVALHGHDKVVSLNSPELKVGEDRLIEIFLRQVIGDTFINAIEVEGHTDGFNQFEGVDYSRKINCGGPALIDAAGDWEEGLVSKGGHDGRPRALDSSSFYHDWAVAEFGPVVGPKAAGIFSRIDGRLPCITFMREGPGNCTPDESEWADVAQLYEFVDDFAALAKFPMGPGEAERFDYWRHHVEAFRAAAKLRCAAARPHEKETLREAWTDLFRHLVEAARTPGDIGTIFSIEQQWRRNNLKEARVDLPPVFDGGTRLVVPVPPSNIPANGVFDLGCSVLGEGGPQSLVLAILDIATGETARHACESTGGCWHRVSLSATCLPAIFSYRVEPATGCDTQATLWRTCVVEPVA